MPQSKIFRNTPISENIDWRKLKGGVEFHNSIAENVDLSDFDELIFDFFLDVASQYSKRIGANGACESIVCAEILEKIQNRLSRYQVIIDKGELV